MAYASPAGLRARYASDLERDEFAAHSDAHLQRALDAASSEIDSWRPPGDLGAESGVILTEKCLTLARMLAHQDQALTIDHPIIRDGMAVRRWLQSLASGAVRLPGATGTDGTTAVSGIAVGSPDRVYTSDWLSAYTL